jgi:ribonuclease HI
MAGINAEEKQPHFSLPLAPWEEEETDISNSLGNFKKSECPQLLACLAKELISEHEDHLCIYTDGSRLESGEVGSAFVIPKLNVKETYRLNNDVSIFSAELVAIRKALHFLRDHTSHTKVLILSDSKSALQALQNNAKSRKELITDIKTTIQQLAQKKCTVKFQWIPSHTDIQGNEKADAAAKEAAQLPEVTCNIGTSLTEMKGRVKTVIKKKWQDRFSSHANANGWPDPDSIEQPKPSLPHNLLPLFYRIRTGYFKYWFTKPICICSQDLEFEHIFVCNEVLQHLPKTTQMLRELGMSIDSKVTLFYLAEQGWDIAATFIKELHQSPIGGLL